MKIKVVAAKPFCSVQVVFLYVLSRIWCHLRLQPGVQNLSLVPRHISASVGSGTQVGCDAGQHHLDRTCPPCLPVSCGMPPSILNPTVLHLPALCTVLTVEARNMRILLLTTLKALPGYKNEVYLSRNSSRHSLFCSR